MAFALLHADFIALTCGRFRFSSSFRKCVGRGELWLERDRFPHTNIQKVTGCLNPSPLLAHHTELHPFPFLSVASFYWVVVVEMVSNGDFESPGTPLAESPWNMLGLRTCFRNSETHRPKGFDVAVPPWP